MSLDERAAIAANATKAAAIEGFQAWLEKPEIKMLISMLPPMATEQQKDCFRTIVMSAFTTGYDSGRGNVAIIMLKAMMDRDTKR